MRITPVTFWRDQKKITAFIGKKGTVLSYSLIQVAPHGFAIDAPYYIALIELEDKTRLTSQIVLTPGLQMKIGSTCLAMVRKLHTQNNEDIIPYIVKFKLI